MLTLRELQSEFRRALLGGVDGEPAGALSAEVLADGLSPEARLAIYRHHVVTTLTATLKGTYPVVARLVGNGFFAYAGDAFVRRHPPAGPCLFEYGAGFGEFLVSFPPCRDFVYLPDVARLEWAMNAALHAEDAHAIDLGSLGGISAEAIATVTLRLDPSVTLLSSPWPVDRIWRANQSEADAKATTIDLRAGSVCLEVRRLDDEVIWRTLPSAEHAFRSALAAAEALERAAHWALAVDSGFDLVGAIHAVFAEGLVTGFEVLS
jgi:putative DNA-binding protein